MSIHPEFAQSILNGEKKVEFRKTCFASQVSHIVIYATSPLKKIVGYFEVQGIKVAPPKELWLCYSKVAGIEQEFFQEYYYNIDKGVAIEIGRVHNLNHFLALKYISDSLIAPQSYTYLSKNLFDLIRVNQIDS